MNTYTKAIKQIHILLVEDNDGDILLTTEALEEGKIINKISLARDGQEAIKFLTDKIGDNEEGFPDLILLDVNLPKMNGHEVLQVIKNNEHLKHIPVIVLTTSSSEKDIIQSYKNHANCFITKPVDINDFLNVVSSIEKFWISIVELPRK